jgi:competence protein ComEA
MVVAHVIGKVRRPGLVRLAAGCRVSDAVTAAGGPAPQARLDRLNLARLLGDGEQIMVPGPNDPMPSNGALAADVGSPSGAAPGANGLVDLNTATTSSLDALPGVGPVLAGRILAWRTQHGRFSRVAELGEVPGIGDKLLAQLTPLVRV